MLENALANRNEENAEQRNAQALNNLILRLRNRGFNRQQIVQILTRLLNQDKRRRENADKLRAKLAVSRLAESDFVRLDALLSPVTLPQKLVQAGFGIALEGVRVFSLSPIELQA